MNWIKKTIGAVVLALLYLALFMWFRSHDVWNVSANVSAGEILAWTTLRLVFMVCLGIACLTTGRIVLMWLTKSFEDLGTLEKMLFYFFVGSAVLRMGMFFIGLKELYKPFFVFLGSLPLLLLFPFVFDMQQMYRRCVDAVKRNLLESICVGGLCLIAATILGIVYFGHCQYSFDGDYLTHYGPFYDHVIQSGGLAPNDVWYQYFYSKGAGLFYFSMLITDRTGPLLVSFLHFFAAATLIYAIMKRACGSSLWAISTVIFMLGMMAWPNEGFFIKHHCEISAVILAITCVVVLMAASKRHRNLCMFVACILQVSLLLYSLQAGAYTLMFIVVYAAIALCRHNHGLALRYAFVLGLGGVTSLLSMMQNYSVTGLYEITPFRVFLTFWNQTIFSKWVSSYLMFYLSEGSSSELGTIGISSTLQSLVRYAQLFRLEKFFFLRMFWVVSGFLIGLGFWDALRKTRWWWKTARSGMFGIFLHKREEAPGGTASSAVPLLGCDLEARGFSVNEMSAMRGNALRRVMLPSSIVCLLVFLVYVFVRQPISILRLSEFVSMYVTLLIFSVLIVCSSLISRSIVYRTTSILVPVLLSLVTFSAAIDHSRGGKVKIPLKFALGRLTANELAPVDKNLSTQYPKIRAVAGEHSRIASLNINVDYGPLFLQYPGIMTEVSYAFGNRWHEIVFGDPDSAKKALQALGINFFLVNLDAPMFGALPYSPLFTGQSLATNFRIVWQLGSHYLLTWNDGQNGMRPKFLFKWGTNLRRGMPSTTKGTADYGQSLYDRVLYLYEINKHSLHGIVRPDNLKKVEGWQ